MVFITTTILTNSTVKLANTNTSMFGGNLAASSDEFSWLAGFSQSNAVRIQGSGLTYSGSGDGRELSGGTVSRIVFDTMNDNGSTTAGDLVITGTEGLNAAAIRKGDMSAFWGEVLKGDDVFNLFGLGEDDIGFGNSDVFGDDFSLIAGKFSVADQGGDDDMFGADNEVFMVGDVLTVEGNDGGDVFVPATYTGGDDFNSGAVSDRRNDLAGDAAVVWKFGELLGGNDTIDSSRNSSVSTSITGDALNLLDNGFVRGGDDVLLGRDGKDEIYGEIAGGPLTGVTGDDSIFGGSGNDRLFGQTGNDRLNGGAGDDELIGGSANDVLLGDAGKDRLAGGGGRETFYFGKLSDSAVGGLGDVIFDLSQAENDVVDVSNIDAKAATKGNNAFAQFIGAASFSAEGQIRAVQQGADTIVEFNTSGASGAETQFELMDFAASTLTLADFVA